MPIKSLKEQAAERKANRPRKKRVSKKKVVVKPKRFNIMCAGCGDGVDGGRCEYHEGEPRCSQCSQVFKV